jgi:hypothetical protein
LFTAFNILVLARLSWHKYLNQQSTTELIVSSKPRCQSGGTFSQRIG